MAETTLTVAEITSAGVTNALASANADGSKFVCPNDRRTFLRVKNANGSNCEVTIHAQRSSANVPGVGAVAIDDIVVDVVATTGDVMIGPIPPAYVDMEGYAHVTYEAVTSLTVQALHIADPVTP